MVFLLRKENEIRFFPKKILCGSSHGPVIDVSRYNEEKGELKGAIQV